MNPKRSKISIRTRLIVAVTCLAFFAGCAQIAVVSEKRPAPLPPGSDADRVATQTIDRALVEEKKQPIVALGGFVAAARDSLRQLDRNPANAEARRDYNFAVARIFTVVRDAKLDPWTQPMRVGANGEFTLTWKRDPRPEWDPALYDLIPADELDFKGTYVKDHVTKEGIGAPLVAKRELTAQQASAFFCPPYIYYSVTATAQFEGSRCVISVNDPLAAESVRVDGHTYPLAANFTASYALLLAREKPQKLGFARLLRPQEYAATARVARLEPYNPNKTVVLVIHGLMDTPVTWVPMVNDLRGDVDFRRNYQVWFYSYPSGYPYPYSAVILRQELDAIEKKFPLRKPMVVIGHSMGGCITRTLITDTGTKLWMDAFGRPPAKTEMPAASKHLLEEAIIFKHRGEIGRVVFMSTPHRGANLASNWIGRIGSMLVRTPTKLLTIGRTLRESLTTDPAALQLKSVPNSVDTMAPNNRFVMGINTIPITPGIPYHSIIGDRGRGDSPNSSDGVVPYWSSHLDGARSEFIAPCDHGSPKNPQAIAEVHRILKLNAQSN
ncbi:MAG: alpha/beta fold hydrolase [Verrucomicrobia bacterium]|nr:MAG: alpha/beta fold hydrolase [Verrucomicrobiota bacterium]